MAKLLYCLDPGTGKDLSNIKKTIYMIVLYFPVPEQNYLGDLTSFSIEKRNRLYLHPCPNGEIGIPTVNVGIQMAIEYNYDVARMAKLVSRL